MLNLLTFLHKINSQLAHANHILALVSLHQKMWMNQYTFFQLLIHLQIEHQFFQNKEILFDFLIGELKNQ